MMKLMESCNNSSAVNFTEELKFNTLDVHISVIVGAILGFIILGTIFGNISNVAENGNTEIPKSKSATAKLTIK